jgi:hypothetical protein
MLNFINGIVMLFESSSIMPKELLPLLEQPIGICRYESFKKYYLIVQANMGTPIHNKFTYLPNSDINYPHLKFCAGDKI